MWVAVGDCAKEGEAPALAVAAVETVGGRLCVAREETVPVPPVTLGVAVVLAAVDTLNLLEAVPVTLEEPEAAESALRVAVVDGEPVPEAAPLAVATVPVTEPLLLRHADALPVRPLALLVALGEPENIAPESTLRVAVVDGEPVLEAAPLPVATDPVAEPLLLRQADALPVRPLALLVALGEPDNRTPESKLRVAVVDGEPVLEAAPLLDATEPVAETLLVWHDDALIERPLALPVALGVPETTESVLRDTVTDGEPVLEAAPLPVATDPVGDVLPVWHVDALPVPRSALGDELALAPADALVPLVRLLLALPVFVADPPTVPVAATEPMGTALPLSP